MSGAIVAKRYADALFQLADKKNITESLISELEVVKEVVNTNELFVQMLNYPQITNDIKMNLIDETFGKSQKDVINLIKLLVERQRIDIIVDVIDQVTERYNEANGIAVATVSSVRELSDNEKENIADSLKKQLQKKDISIHNIIDPSVLGGLKIRVGNTIYDGTISGKLEQMRNNIGTTTN